MASTGMLVLAIAFLIAPITVDGSKKFLSDESRLSGKAFQDDIINAMGSMLGCGGQASEEKMSSIQKTLEPMWKTLPKNKDRIDRRSLRYLVHRYFMQTSSLMIRGFEPTRSVNESHWGVADILSQMVPAYVEAALESNHAKNKGFSLKDAVSMIAMLEQLIFDSESSLLSKIYEEQHKPTQRSLTHKGLMQILESYMVHWMVDGDPEDIELLKNNRSLLVEVLPHFEELVAFAEGRVKMLQYARQVRGAPKGRASDTWAAKYSFGDAHEIVGGITQTFQSYWQSECESMKNALTEMDTHHTGRVPLSKFYSTAINTDWRFGESEAYLRELGALDESSSHAGTQVLISNYIQAISNCIVSAPHYLVCCRNDCEDILGEIERFLGSPTATPSDILPVVGNITFDEDDESPKLEGALTEQLEEIAKLQGGVVPLHGRLFAQWLHYVFPRECPFPHLMGAVSSVTPQQYGEEYVATQSDMKKAAKNASVEGLPTSVGKEELQWMSQWSPEEEFIVDYSSELGMSWQKRLLLALAGLALLSFGITGGVVGCNRKATLPNKKCWV